MIRETYVYSDKLGELTVGLTPGKRYKIKRRPFSDNCAVIDNDAGKEMTLYLPKCPHLDDRAWSTEIWTRGD